MLTVNSDDNESMRIYHKLQDEKRIDEILHDDELMLGYLLSRK